MSLLRRRLEIGRHRNPPQDQLRIKASLLQVNRARPNFQGTLRVVVRRHLARPQALKRHRSQKENTATKFGHPMPTRPPPPEFSDSAPPPVRVCHSGAHTRPRTNSEGNVEEQVPEVVRTKRPQFDTVSAVLNQHRMPQLTWKEIFSCLQEIYDLNCYETSFVMIG